MSAFLISSLFPLFASRAIFWLLSSDWRYIMRLSTNHLVIKTSFTTLSVWHSNPHQYSTLIAFYWRLRSKKTCFIHFSITFQACLPSNILEHPFQYLPHRLPHHGSKIVFNIRNSIRSLHMSLGVSYNPALGFILHSHCCGIPISSTQTFS